MQAGDVYASFRDFDHTLGKKSQCVWQKGKKWRKALNDNEKNGKIKAMLLDLNMPNVNGFEVLDYFKSNDLFKKYPTSIITGVDDKESIEKAYKYPIIDILLKPFNERDIKEVVEKTVQYAH